MKIYTYCFGLSPTLYTYTAQQGKAAAMNGWHIVT